jgi:uncharacterized protein (DUF1778 family)
MIKGEGGGETMATRTARRATRSEKLDLRLTPHAKTALQKFVLESALARADEALADRRTFGLDAAQWKAFMAALDAAPRALPRLGRLLEEPGFFDDSTGL